MAAAGIGRLPTDICPALVAIVILSGSHLALYEGTQNKNLMLYVFFSSFFPTLLFLLVANGRKVFFLLCVLAFFSTSFCLHTLSVNAQGTERDASSKHRRERDRKKTKKEKKTFKKNKKKKKKKIKKKKKKKNH